MCTVYASENNISVFLTCLIFLYEEQYNEVIKNMESDHLGLNFVSTYDLLAVGLSEGYLLLSLNFSIRKMGSK